MRGRMCGRKLISFDKFEKERSKRGFYITLASNLSLATDKRYYSDGGIFTTQASRLQKRFVGLKFNERQRPPLP